MKRLFTLLFYAAVLFAGAGCSNSDENEAAGPDLRADATALVGTWNSTYCLDLFYENGKQVDKEGSKDDWFVLELFADGTLKWTETPDTPDMGTYTYNPETHAIRLNGIGDFGIDDADKSEVKTLTPTRLVLYLEHSSVDESVDWLTKRELSFRKVN